MFSVRHRTEFSKRQTSCVKVFVGRQVDLLSPKTGICESQCGFMDVKRIHTSTATLSGLPTRMMSFLSGWHVAF